MPLLESMLLSVLYICIYICIYIYIHVSACVLVVIRVNVPYEGFRALDYLYKEKKFNA